MLSTITRIREDKRSLYISLAACGVLILAICVRFIGLGTESAWIDEAYSINLAQQSIGQIIQGTAADQHPPLYYLILHFWLIFGDNVTVARSFSAFLGFILVLQVMFFGWKISDFSLGIGAALMVALSPLAVWYSQEARQYMLLACLTTASTIELWNCLQGQKRWVLFCFFSILAIYTQYFAVFIFLAQAVIIVIWSLRKHDSHLMVPFIISFIGVGIVFIPWLPTAINQFSYHTMPWISEPAVGQVRDILLILLLGNGVQVLPPILSWLLVVGLIGIALWALYRLAKLRSEIQEKHLFIALWLLIPFAAISIISIFYPIFQLKQYLIVLVPLLMLAVEIAILFSKPLGNIIFACLLVISTSTMIYQQSVLTKDDWRGAAAYIETHSKAGDLVYGNPAASKLALNLYLDINLPFEGYPNRYDILRGGWAGEKLTTEIIDSQLSLLKKDHKRIWLVEFFPEFWDKNQNIPAWLTENGTKLDDKFFGKIHLRLYKMNP